MMVVSDLVPFRYTVNVSRAKRGNQNILKTFHMQSEEPRNAHEFNFIYKYSVRSLKYQFKLVSKEINETTESTKQCL